MTDVIIRHLEPDEYRSAAGLAARALLDSPTALAIHGDDALDRLAIPHAEFSMLFKILPHPQIGAVCGACPIAVAAASPPGGCIGSFFGTEAAGVLDRPTPGVGDPSRVQVFWAHLAIHDLADEHWHIGPVGVEPGFQGRGIGGAVVRELCALFDLERRVGFLETDKESNVRFYSAHGFEVVDTATILGVPTWFMRRDPAAR
jgi:ribosomal protein S18 acetylase RimI-like enzyme